jgi:hypothetical protein
MPNLNPPEDTLTPEQRDQIDGFLKQPLLLPSEFKSWLPDYLSQNIPYIPVSQLLGYKGTLANNSIVNTEIDLDAGYAAERQWNQYSTGPSVTGLADGTYFLAYGCKTGRLLSGGATTRYGPAINGSDPTTYATFQATDPDAMVSRCAVASVTGANDNNTVECYYWYDLGGGAQAQFLHRWLTVIRIT